jgi:hypothetical protein
MNANGKEFLLYFAKLLECDTSSCRFGFIAALGEKRCEDAPHSKSTSRKSFFDSYQFVSFVGNKIFRKQYETQAFRLHALVQDAEPRAI